MKLPPGYSHPLDFPHRVCRLRRALCGLKQASRAWFAKFSSTISQHDFSGNSFDTALFLRWSDHGITILLLYVDDMIITSDDMRGIQDLKHFLSCQFEMKDLGPLNYFLSLEVSYSANDYYLTQTQYTFDMISRASITDSKIVDTPIEYNYRLNSHDDESLSDATLYRQLVGSLIYSLLLALIFPMQFIFGYVGHYRIPVLIVSLQLNFTVIIEVLFKFLIMMFFLNVLNILKLIVTSFVIICFRVRSHFSLFLLRIS